MIETMILCGAVICAAPVSQLIGLAAVQNGVDPALMMCIAQKESGLDPNAVGDKGLALGIMQFHLKTWRWMRSMMGLSTRDQRRDPWEAARTASWAVSQGLGGHWSVWGLCYGR